MHIIPAAFDYFDDIKQAAFSLVNGLNEKGIETEVTTIQYEAPTPVQKEEVMAVAPAHEYSGETPFEQVREELPGFDLVHVHCPLFGGVKDVFKWKAMDPKTPLVVTYYRDVRLKDLFAFVVRWYNNHYLPRLFDIASAVTCQSAAAFARSSGNKYLNNREKLYVTGADSGAIHLTQGADEVKLIGEQEINKIIALYEQLVNI